MGAFNPALIGKAMRVKALLKQVPPPLAIYETVEDREGGAGVYVFQAKFASKEDALRFMELAKLSKELEASLQ